MAEIIASGDWWRVEDGGRLYIYCEGDMPNYSSINVTPWYSSGESITSAYVLDGVTSVGNSAFYGCSRLTSVAIPNSATSIGSDAFRNCRALTSVTIPDGVTSIGNSAFYDCRALTSVAIPDGVTSIGNRAFYDCHALTSVTIPDSVTSIGNGAFYNCRALTSVTIPDGVTSIGNDAFSYCLALTSVTIPDSVTFIGSSAFYYCPALMRVTIPDGVTSIEGYAFGYCRALTSVTIPDSVTYIGSSAFYDCRALTSVTIPDGVTSVGYRAFYNCLILMRVTIPDSVTSIGSSAFYDCRALTDIYYAGTETQWSAVAIGGGNDWLTSAAIHYDCPPPALIPPGTFSVTVRYTDERGQSFTTSFPLEMASSYCEITAYPTKTDYFIGESLDYTGLVVTAISSDGASRNVTSECVILPEEGAKITEAGDIMVDVTYEGKSLGTFWVSATLEIALPVKMEYFRGEPIDYSGFSITERYSDGTSRDITSECVLSPESGTAITEDVAVTISRNGREIGSFLMIVFRQSLLTGISRIRDRLPSGAFDVFVVRADILTSAPVTILYEYGPADAETLTREFRRLDASNEWQTVYHVAQTSERYPLSDFNYDAYLLRYGNTTFRFDARFMSFPYQSYLYPGSPEQVGVWWTRSSL